MKQRFGLSLVKKDVTRVGVCELREGTTGRVVLPQVWAVAESDNRGQACNALRRDAVVDPQVGAQRAKPAAVQGGVAFYRKYTEGVLRRYLRLSMTGGRVASLLGRELFRGPISNYSVQNFAWMTIFCVDVELCLKRLTPIDRALLKRIAVQQYTQAEAAMVLGISLRACERRYPQALDRLTRIFLEARILEPLKSCQEGREVEIGVTA